MYKFFNVKIAIIFPIILFTVMPLSNFIELNCISLLMKYNISIFGINLIIVFFVNFLKILILFIMIKYFINSLNIINYISLLIGLCIIAILFFLNYYFGPFMYSFIKEFIFSLCLYIVFIIFFYKYNSNK